MYTAAGKSDKNHLVTEHAPLVKKLAHQMKAKLPPSVEVDDLIQAGMIGLLDAVSRYEETHGAQFETYAVQRIRGAMLDELRSSDWMPRSMRQNMRKIEVAMNTLQQRLGRAPNESEVAKQLKLSLADYQVLQRIRRLIGAIAIEKVLVVLGVVKIFVVHQLMATAITQQNLIISQR